MNRYVTSLALILSATLAASGSLAQVTPVATCGLSLAGPAELTADLDCAGYTDGPAITLAGSLSLNGFRLVGNPTQIAILCTGIECRVTGPGVVEGGQYGIWSLGAETLVRHVDLVNAAVTGIYSGRADLRRVSVRNAGDTGVYGNGLKVRRSEVLDSGFHGLYVDGWIDARALKVLRSGRRAIFLASPVERSRISRATIEQNWSGVALSQSALELVLQMNRATIRQNDGYGVSSSSQLVIRRSEITGNSLGGVLAGLAEVFDSIVSGNCLEPNPDPESCCGDIISGDPPEVRGTQCGTSSGFSPDCSNYGVCSLD